MCVAYFFIFVFWEGRSSKYVSKPEAPGMSRKWREVSMGRTKENGEGVGSKGIAIPFLSNPFFLVPVCSNSLAVSFSSPFWKLIFLPLPLSLPLSQETLPVLIVATGSDNIVIELFRCLRLAGILQDFRIQNYMTWTLHAHILEYPWIFQVWLE